MEFTLEGRLFNLPKERMCSNMLQVIAEVNTFGKLACNSSTFLRFLKGIIQETCLQNLSGVTDFSKEKF